MLLKWQQTQRLVGSSDPGWIVEHLFVDSLLFLRVLPPETRSVLDLGSGAGFPGIPIKIVRGDLRVILLESRRRRASFLSAVVRELRLADATVVNARAEQVRQELGTSVDAVVMRCAGDFARLSVLALDLLALGGVVIATAPPGESADSVPVPDAHGGVRRFLVRRRP